MDPKVVLVALSGLENILKSAPSPSESHQPNPYADLIEECYGLDKIEFLQSHENLEIYKKVEDCFERNHSNILRTWIVLICIMTRWHVAGIQTSWIVLWLWGRWRFWRASQPLGRVRSTGFPIQRTAVSTAAATARFTTSPSAFITAFFRYSPLPVLDPKGFSNSHVCGIKSFAWLRLEKETSVQGIWGNNSELLMTVLLIWMRQAVSSKRFNYCPVWHVDQS